MPNTRISDLTAATSVAGTDVYPSVQTAGVGPVKTSLTQITAFALANAPAGAVATPSIAPTGDTNTGFWFPAADTIAASTGGSERLRINSSGNVGIGTASPTRKLHVLGGDSLNAMIVGASNALCIGSTASYGYLESLDTTGSISYNPLWLGGSIVQLGVSGSEKMRITSAGNVGIGTTSPAKLLDVKTTAITSGTATNETIRITATFSGGLSAATTVGSLGFSDGTYQTALINALVETPASNAAGAMAFYTSTSGGVATERMRITSAGNVLINTTSISTGCIAAINGKIDLKTGNTSIGKIEAAKSISVTTSATTVISGYVFGGLAIVNGNDGTNQFTDLVFWGYSGTPTVISSQTISGSPAARTYTAVVGDLKLAMASGTYTVAAVAITANNG